MKRLLKTILWTLLIAYVVITILGQLVHNRMLFFPPPTSYQAGGPIQLIPTKAGGQLAVWMQKNEAADYTILYSHGNAESLGEVAFISQMFVGQGFSFVAYDYSGYGLSSGEPSVKATYRDIETVYQFLTEEQGVDPAKLILFGNSIGSGPSTYLATKKPVGGLILQSAFTSIYRVVTKVPIFLGSPYPSLKRIRSIDCPLVVIHGTADSVIPFSHGEQLYEKAKEPKVFHPMEDTNHNEVFLFAGEDYWAAISELFQSVRAPRSQSR